MALVVALGKTRGSESQKRKGINTMTNETNTAAKSQTFRVKMLSGNLGAPVRLVKVREDLIAAQAVRVRDQTEFDGMGYPIDECSVRRGALMEILEAVFVQGQNDFNPVLGVASVSVGDVIELPEGLAVRLDLFTVGHWVVTPEGFKPLTDTELAEYAAIPVLDRTWSKFVRPEFAAKQAAKNG